MSTIDKKKNHKGIYATFRDPDEEIRRNLDDIRLLDAAGGIPLDRTETLRKATREHLALLRKRAKR